MSLDDAIKEAFAREFEAVPERRPSASDVARALGGPRAAGRRNRVKALGSAVPLFAFAAASLVMGLMSMPAMEAYRPLARELSLTIPEEAGARFIDFMLKAGESYRSSN